jgi:predicted metal-dependent phosphoesterase TrpH
LLKLELHSHSDEDLADLIPHTTTELIDRAAALGYGALALTLHDRQLEMAPYRSYAAERGVTLIPGIERTIEGKHVLLLNFSPATEQVRSFDDLARLRARERGLVVAPHPFFPAPNCLGRARMERHAELFDAVEINGMFLRALDFNRRAREWARVHGKPLVGNGDVHRLSQLGTTYSLVEADAHPDAICEAIRAGRVRVEAQPHSVLKAFAIMADLAVADIRRDVLRQPAGPRPLRVSRP